MEAETLANDSLRPVRYRLVRSRFVELEQVAQTCGYRLLVFLSENPTIATSVFRNLL